MVRFKTENVNPKHRKTGDCSTRAIAGLLGISWAEALRMQMEEAIKSAYAPDSKQVIERVLAHAGYVKMKQPRKADGKKYMVAEIDQLLTPSQLEKGTLVTVANHATLIKGGAVVDTWDCRGKSISNYFVKWRWV